MAELTAETEQLRQELQSVNVVRPQWQFLNVGSDHANH